MWHGFQCAGRDRACRPNHSRCPEYRPAPRGLSARFHHNESARIGGRDKPKDAYDICYCLTNFPGGLEKLAAAWNQRSEDKDVKRALVILREKFATVDGFGPGQVIEFLDLSSREAQEIQARRAFELVQKFLTLV